MFFNPPYNINRLIWVFIALISAIDAAWMARAGMEIAWGRSPIGVFSLMFATSMVYRTIRPDEHIYQFAQICMQLVAGSLALAVFSYLTARLNLPLVDEWLIAADHVICFDWGAWISWLNARPLAWALLLSCAYHSLAPQMALLLFLLFMHKRIAHIQRFIIAFFYAGLIVILLGALFPTMGGYAHYQLDLSQFANLHPIGATSHSETLALLRSHSITIITSSLSGVVMFPSFHGALAILMMYASLPIRWLRYIMIPLNLLVLISTPADGGHYLVDVIAGCLIAFHAIWLARKLLPPTVS